MANVIFDNVFLSNEIEDQYNSHLDLQQFCTVDNNLVGNPGMKRVINCYSATDGTEKVAMGEGNTKSIEVNFNPTEYTVLTAQNRFEYFDEEAMRDPNCVPVGLGHAAVDMFNTVNADIFAEFNKATLKVETPAYDFGAFVDAVAKLNVEDAAPEDGGQVFGFLNPSDMAEVRKALKNTLQYVEDFARTGYVGTVGGVNLYTKRDAVKGTCCLGTQKAVTLFNKKGMEVEQERDANIRKNSIYSRKCYIAALTDATKACKIIIKP